METGKYSGSWLPRLKYETHPLSRLHRSQLRNIGMVPVRPADVSSAIFNRFETYWAHRLEVYVPATPTIGPGKLYPVTAAQLLPNLTGFLTPLHDRN